MAKVGALGLEGAHEAVALAVELAGIACHAGHVGLEFGATCARLPEVIFFLDIAQKLAEFVVNDIFELERNVADLLPAAAQLCELVGQGVARSVTVVVVAHDYAQFVDNACLA